MRNALGKCLTILTLAALVGCGSLPRDEGTGESIMGVHYTEIVCNDVAAQCAALP